MDENPASSNDSQTPAPVPAMTPDTTAMIANFRAVDPLRNGVGLHQLRPFYPKVGWGKIRSDLRVLEANGLVTKTNVMNERGGVAYQVYKWVE